MDEQEKIMACYKDVSNYPELARRLGSIGVESYTVDTASSAILYRFDEGKNVHQSGKIPVRMISENFNKEQTIAAIRNNQQGKTDYSGFMDDIAGSGVRFYEATLQGNNRRVTYIGIGGMYEEVIPDIGV